MKSRQASKRLPPARPVPNATALHSPGLLRALIVAATAIASAAVFVLGGCASSAGIEPVARPVTPATVGLEIGASTSPALEAAWWRAYGDPVMSGLIERALAGNPTLKVAQARLARASAAIAGRQAAGEPQVNASVDLTRQRFSANSLYPPPVGGSTLTLGTAQLGVSWELDFFGRNRAAVEAAVGSERAAQADLDAARNLLATQVARTYVQLGRLQNQRAVAAGALKQREDTLALIQQRVQSGLDTNVELRQGEGSVPAARREIVQLDEQIMLSRHALAALTGQPPGALQTLSPSLSALQAMPLPTALPADLLGRRADVAAARWRVEAAASDVRSAKADFYPNVDLVAFAGLSSIGLDQLVRSGSSQFGVGPAIRLPIFDAGRLRAQLRGKTADLDAAVESYNATVLEAVHEAADQIGSLRSVELQRTEQALALTAAESAYDLALQRYRAGLSTYLVVLTAEFSVLNQRHLDVDLGARALDAQLALIRALGGGYVPDTGDRAPSV